MNVRDHFLAMKGIAFSLVALLLGVVPAESQLVPGQPASGVSNTVQSAGKLTIAHPWEDVTIRLLIPASAQAPGRTENVKAKRAFYHVPPKSPHRLGGLVCIVAAENLHTDKTFIIEGVSDRSL